MAKTDRRSVLHAAAGTCAALLGTPPLTAAPRRPQSQVTRPEPLAADLVFEFVKVAHTDLDATRQLLQGEPRLIKATWDWGGGDFETAIGAAGHMGRRDIAGFLLDSGAAIDLFVAAMLGRITVVQAALEGQPSLFHVPGPHGIPLIAHARAGGEPAATVLEYLTEFESSRG
jgi:hypothetical protein